MQITAESTDIAIAGLKIIMPTLAEQVAIKLGIPVRKVAIDNWVVVPYMEKDDEHKN